MSKRKKIIFVAVIVFIIIFTCFIFRDHLIKEYYVLFKKDRIVFKFNKFHRLDGEFIVFKGGVIKEFANYKNGVLDGWGYDCYPNGQIKNKRYYHSGKANGPEFQYYPDGTINYKGVLRDNKRFGSFCWYSTNGKLQSYSVFDINGQAFCKFNYNNLGEITKILQIPISPYTYSIDKRADTTILLHFEEKNQNVKDLYVVVATPPNTRSEINTVVNNVRHFNVKVSDNTIKIENAFSNKGINTVIVRMTMFYKDRKIIDNFGADLSIIREW